jgi:hypothetical protein
MSLISYRSQDQVKVFRWIDALTFGLAALLANAIFVYFLFNAENQTGQGTALLIVTGLLFWLPYVMLLISRAKWIKNISYITKHGLPVVTNGFPVKKEDVERITDETIAAWDKAIPWNQSATAIQTLFIEFKPFPITEEGNTTRKFAGLLKNSWALVGYKDNLDQTALAHELGHEIHHAWTGYYDNDGCHQYMKDHNLP